MPSKLFKGPTAWDNLEVWLARNRSRLAKVQGTLETDCIETHPDPAGANFTYHYSVDIPRKKRKTAPA